MNMLFIGGCRDGQVEWNHRPAELLTVTKPQPPVNVTEIMGPPPAAPPDFELDTYILTRIPAGKVQLIVYRHEDLSLEKMFVRLLTAYETLLRHNQPKEV